MWLTGGRAKWACGGLLLLLAGVRLSAEPAPVDAGLEQSLQGEVSRFVDEDRAHPPAPCSVLFVGSSSIVKWRENLAADMAPLPVINRGFGGSHIEYVNRWFDQLVAPSRPRTIVFYAGENDLDAGKSIESVVQDFDAFLKLKRAALGATPVYFISVKPSKARIAELSQQTALNNVIHARAMREPDLHYIDVASAMLEDGQPKDIFGPDGLHMNRAGYRLWRQLVRHALLPSTAADRQACLARLAGSP